MKKYLGIGLLFITLSFVISGCASLKSLYAETPDEQGEITIIMDDFEFRPGTVKFEAGETVRIKLINRGTKAHEFMIGVNPTVHDGQTEVFTTDFFTGIEVKASGPGMAMRMGEMDGMDMGGEEDMDMEEGDMDMEEGDMDMEEGDHEDGGHEEGEDHEEGEGMDMGEGEDHEEEEGMDMEEGDHEDGGHEEGDDHEDEGMDMKEEEDHEEGEHEEAGHEDGDDHEGEEGDHADEEEGGHAHEEEEAAMSGEFAAVQEPLMHPHPGYMVLLQPITVQPNEEPTIIEFTIPEDKAGVWTIGCFQESGLHFDDGMRGTLIVTPAD